MRSNGSVTLARIYWEKPEENSPEIYIKIKKFPDDKTFWREINPYFNDNDSISKKP